MNELVIIRTFNSSLDFEIVKSYLESFEIDCYGQDEVYSKGGVKLQVRNEQAEQAIKILLEKGYLKVEDFNPSIETKWVERIMEFFSRK